MDLTRALLRIALGRRLPLYDGTLRLPGLKQPVRIRRDRYAIPHIEAAEDDDAWFALGFCQGQDRPFQVELRLRLVRGTLAALIGSEVVAIDRLSRRVGLHEAAARQLLVLAPEVRAQAEAFARGINAGLTAGLRGRRPHALMLLRGRASHWDAADVLGVGKMMSLLLIGNWDIELARLKILTLDGEQALRDLDPSYPEDQPVTAPPDTLAGPAVDRLSDDIAAFAAFAGANGGSNSWVVAGSRTASGRPLLANDPHLEPALPPHWYLAHLRTPRWALAGAALVGGSAVGIGHNGFAAWGITAGLVDTVDLFLEQVGPDGHSIRQGDAFVTCPVRREVIEVKGAQPVVEEVLVTPRGPLIGPALEGEPGAVSMSAVWLQPRPVRGFLRVHAADSFDAFRHEFEAWPLLNQNVVYADTTGRIAWQLVGEAPVRKKGWGTLPLAGWDPEAGWQSEGVPFESMPHAADPVAGFIATANSKPQRDGEGPYLGADWLDGYRQARIAEVVGSRDDWDVVSTLRLQLDETSVAWRDAKEAVLACVPVSEDAGVAQKLLSAWDGALTIDSAAGTVFEFFLTEIWGRVARARAPNAAAYALGKGFASLLPITTFAAGRSSRILRLLSEQPPGWFEEGWPVEIEAALAAAIERLRSEHGADPARWGWGRLRPLTLRHPLGRVRRLAPLFNRGPFPWGGDGNTISQAGTSPLRYLGNPLVVASLRAVIDIGAWEEARFALPGGQSGNPFSPHYDDLLAFWLRGEGVPIAWSEEAVASATRSILNLQPEGE